jgi:predicted ATPase
MRSSVFNDGDERGTGDGDGDEVTISTGVVSALSNPDWSIIGGGRVQHVTLTSLQSEAIEPSTCYSTKCRESALTTSNRLSGRGKLNFSALKLYGRTGEIETLRKCFEAIRETTPISSQQRTEQPMKPSSTMKTRQGLVLISGNSGTGKSSLAYSLKDEVMKKGGFFVSGKFDLQQSDIPYAGFADAISEVCQSLIEHKYNAGNPSWTFSYDSIQAALRRELIDAPALTMLVPAIQRIVATNSTETTDSPKNSAYLEAKYRFDREFKTFIQVVSEFGPLVMVLDDLQWADHASLDLLYILTTDPNNNSSCLFIGLYRSRAVGIVSTPLSYTIQDIRSESSSATSEAKTGIGLTELEIGDLSVDAIDLMLVDLLVRDAKNGSQDTRLLAECVHQKTRGNAFFVAQFLRSLAKQGLLYYDYETDEWQWDAETVKIEASATDNVVDFINGKLYEMPTGIRKYMPLIASLGSSFRISMVNILFEHLEDDSVVDNDVKDGPLTAEHFARMYEEEGILVRVAEDVYQFSHDKMKSSALSLEKPETLSSLQFRFGLLLLDRLSNDELSDNIYVVASLLDRVELLPENDPRKVAIARVFLMAGKKAFLTSASLQASKYFQTGIDMLPSDQFISQYELSVELYSSVAEAYFCQGKFERMREYCDLILGKKDIPLLDKRRVYNAMLNSLLAEGRPYDARILCTEVLARLGVRFPQVGQSLHTLAWMLRMKLCWKRSIPNVTNLEFISDDRHVWIMSLLDNLTTCCYQTAQEMMPLVIIRGFKLTLRNGLTIQAPIFLTTVALLCVIIEDFHGAKLYCDEALKLLDLVVNRQDVEARTLFVAYQFVQHWQIPVDACLEPLLRAYQAGMVGTMSMWWYHHHTTFCVIHIPIDIVSYTFLLTLSTFLFALDWSGIG